MARRRLKTAQDLRRYLADLINRVEQKEITPETASKLGYLANILLRVIEGADFEARIEALENQQNEEPTCSANDPRNDTQFR
jgi:hypothetical protein